LGAFAASAGGRGHCPSTTLLSTTTSAGGGIGEALAFTNIFANHYNRFFIRPSL